MKLCKGTGYKGIKLGGFYIGYQYNLPLRKTLLRFHPMFATHRFYLWLGPFYIDWLY